MTKVLFTFLALVMTTVAFSQDDALVRFILANEDVCVREYNEDKIYLKSDHIISTDKGLFLIVNGVSAPINALYSDGQGCYLKPMLKWEVLNRCRGCGNPYFIRCRTLGCRYNPDTPK